MFVENQATKGMFDHGQGRILRCATFFLQTYDLSEVWKGNIGGPSPVCHSRARANPDVNSGSSGTNGTSFQLPGGSSKQGGAVVICNAKNGRKQILRIKNSYFYEKTTMDIQTRKIQFIQEFLKCANDKLLSRFEEMLKEERTMAFEKEIKPMTLREYEQRIDKAVEDVKNNKVKSARNLKKDIATWR